MKQEIRFPLIRGEQLFCILSIFSLFIMFNSGFAQHLTGSYHVSAPEASLFSLKPGYLNPAIESGVLGIMSNPASLDAVDGQSVGLAFILPQTSEGSFSIQAADSSEFYDPIVIDARVKIQELGGLSAFGFAQQHGRLRWGAVLYQPLRSGFSLQARGDLPLKTHYEFDKPLTRQEIPDLPVEEIPVLWDITSDINLHFSSTPTEIYLSVLPIVVAASYRLGPLSVGAGLQYYQYSSGNKPTQLVSEITGTGTVTGTPYGSDTQTGLPWAGSFSADFTIADQPLVAEYSVDLSGNRFALSTGFALNWGPLSLGASYAHGFGTTMKGSYVLRTIRTSGPPDLDRIAQAQVDWTLRPELSGHVSLDFADFEKDTVAYEDSGSLSFGGYHSFGAGIRFLFLGAFVRGQIPVQYPEFGAATFGVYVAFPIPFTPIRLNAGLLSRTDGVMSSQDHITPYRVTTHLTAGTAIRLPLNRWFGIGKSPAWIRIGVRSSLISMALSGIEENINEPESKRIPPIDKTLGLSLGLETPLEF